MDSCNSGSLQSSSGGDDEYDSRAAFMSGGIGQVNSNPPPPTPFFDPFIATYTQPHDVISYPKTTPSIIDSSLLNNNSNTATAENYPFAPPPHPQPATAPPTQNIPARNSKKRSRASRRAPTTVLTTDTTNFRAMVQEFTGIPAPPFNNMGLPFARNRLDLLSSSIDVPSYLRSSFAQRVQSSSALPFLGGNNDYNSNHMIIVSTSSAASSSCTQSLNLLSNNIVEEQIPFLGSMNLPSSNHHQKIDSFGHRRSKDGNQQLHGSIGVFSSSADEDQIRLSNLNDASATFDGGLRNLIMPPSSSSSSNNISNLLTRNIHEHADDYDRAISGKSMANYPAGSKLNIKNRSESNSDRQGMVETWIIGSSSD